MGATTVPAVTLVGVLAFVPAASDTPADARALFRPLGSDRAVVVGAERPQPAPRAGLNVSAPTSLAGVDADWNNFGGNAQRNGRASVTGPNAAEILWTNDDDFSIIAWHPVTLDRRVFAIRERGFPADVPNDALVAYDLDTGDELWRTTVPYAGDPDEEWIAYVAGAHGGRVYASRGGSGRTTPVRAFDVTDGDLIWSSVYETVAGPQDGVVFAPDGDLIVGDFDNIVRIDAEDGSTVWRTARSCPVSGNCGCVISADGVFIDIPAGGGNRIAKYDLATGGFLYQTEIMAGFTAQNAPFVSADGGTVYFARSQNNPATDFLYAFEDTGAALVEKWNRPVRWTTSHEHGLGADGSIYTFLPGNEFVRLDPATGEVVDTAGVLGPIGVNLSARTAIGADGTVYVSNGWASNPPSDGRIWAFTGDLETSLFTLFLDRQNSGGPSLGADGTLVVADRTSVRAYRTATPCPGDVDESGDVGFNDLLAVLAAWGPCKGDCPEDVDQSGDVGFNDVLIVLANWGPCP